MAGAAIAALAIDHAIGRRAKHGGLPVVPGSGSARVDRTVALVHQRRSIKALALDCVGADVAPDRLLAYEFPSVRIRMRGFLA